MPILMAFLYALIGALASAAGTLIGKALIAFGVGVVTYTGLRTALDAMFNQVKNNLHGVNADVTNILGVLKLDIVLSIVFSALVARMILNGLTGDKVKRWVTK